MAVTLQLKQIKPTGLKADKKEVNKMTEEKIERKGIEELLEGIGAKTVLVVVEEGSGGYKPGEGWEKYAQVTSEKLCSEGYEVSVLTHKDPQAYCSELGIKVKLSGVGKDGGGTTESLMEFAERKMMESVDAVVYIAGCGCCFGSSFAGARDYVSFVEGMGIEKVFLVMGETSLKRGLEAIPEKYQPKVLVKVDEELEVRQS